MTKQQRHPAKITISAIPRSYLRASACICGKYFLASSLSTQTGASKSVRRSIPLPAPPATRHHCPNRRPPRPQPRAPPARPDLANAPSSHTGQPPRPPRHRSRAHGRKTPPRHPRPAPTAAPTRTGRAATPAGATQTTPRPASPRPPAMSQPHPHPPLIQIKDPLTARHLDIAGKTLNILPRRCWPHRRGSVEGTEPWHISITN